MYNDFENLVTKAIVEVDPARAQRAGVTTAEIANSLQALLEGGTATEEDFVERAQVYGYLQKDAERIATLRGCRYVDFAALLETPPAQANAVAMAAPAVAAAKLAWITL